MRTLFLFLFLFIILVLVHSVSGLNYEGEALVLLLNRTTQSNSMKLRWNMSDSTPCNWRGIHCDQGGRVISVNMVSSGISGQLGQEIGRLKFLEKLDLSMNSFSGRIPSELGNCSQLKHLDLSTNNFFGEIPEILQSLTHLVNISLHNNNFSGVIPQMLGINSSLENIDLMNNKFSGQIPPNLCFRHRLKVLHLGKNLLQGHIPSDVSGCPTLRRLILKQNNLTGALPQFEENQNLLLMDISKNNVNGTIPSSLGNCRNLTSINLSKNKLTGSIPREFGELIQLQKLDLSNNQLHGPLPPELSKCKALYSLNLGINTLNGSIPSSLQPLTKLSTLILRENHFTGGIPDFLMDFKMLMELELGGNPLGGHIPPSIGKLTNLAYSLNLSGNGLTGEIPNQLSSLCMLESLDISRNNLTGSLSSLPQLVSLLELNISYNQFKDSLTDKLLNLLNSQSSFLGNPGLLVPCKLLSGFKFEGNFSSVSCHTGSNGSKGLGRAKIAMIAIGSSMFTIFMILMSSYMTVKFRKQVGDLGYGYFPQMYPMSLEDVMKATDNLNERFIIGRGAHGVVYKAEFNSGNRFAVKKLVFSGHRGANISMRREIQTVGTIKHRNLVRLEDYWFQKEYGLILYEYMPNGSVHDVLHEISPPPYISWDVRYKIALGTAEGLAYLHNDCNPAIVHQDIKPKNILLDADMEPHISDFGIAKLMDYSPASIRTITVIGTVGYIAPEIAFTMMKNKGTDVYSYGVVLLELITRKKVMDPSFPDDMNIVRWAHAMWNRNNVIDGIVEPIYGPSYFFLNPDVEEEMKTVVRIALQCTEREPRRRPTMREVVKQLKDARTFTLTAVRDPPSE